MTSQRDNANIGQNFTRNLDELARATGLKPVESLEDLDRFRLDVWDSDEDLGTFLADARASRNAGVG